MWWTNLNALANTIGIAAVLFGVFVVRPLVESFLEHQARQRLRQQKAEALEHGHDPSRLDPDYLEHVQLMRLRDLQAVALEHGYDPLKLDPDYEFEEKEKEKSMGDEDEAQASLPAAVPHEDSSGYVYLQGYQGQQTGRDHD